MTEEQIALARRAVACRGWKWLPGMATVEAPPKAPCLTIPEWDAARVLSGAAQTDVIVCTVFGKVRDLHHDALPDLTDPATLGCLLALVREAWGDPGMFVRPRGSKMRPDWAVFTGANSDIVCASLSEAEALVAALEAAP